MNFNLTNKYDDETKEILYPLNYGSTSNVYFLNKNIVVKIYNNKLRWKHECHNNSTMIFENETNIANKLNFQNSFQKIIKITDNKIYMENLGISLFDEFVLPDDWKDQIKHIFDLFDKNNIFYSEFNLKNIMNKNNKLYFVDFGLAKYLKNINNNNNCENFIFILSLFENKFKEIKNIEQQHIYYNNFITNAKLNDNPSQKTKYCDNIY